MASEIVASAWGYTGPKAGLYRGVIDTVEAKHGALGTYQSGERLWRCHHEHRTEATAQKCADRVLRRGDHGH